MQAPPLKRRTRQRFTEFDNNEYCALIYVVCGDITNSPTHIKKVNQ